MDRSSKPSFYLIPFSFENSIFSDKLKSAKIHPVIKNGDCSSVCNYRPISLLSVFLKIYEKIIFNRVYDYMTLNTLLYKNQFRFQIYCSTEHTIIELSNKISMPIDKREHVLGVFIDLSKAFDTVDHGILLSKLKHYGIKVLTYKWVKTHPLSIDQSVTYQRPKRVTAQQCLFILQEHSKIDKGDESDSTKEYDEADVVEDNLSDGNEINTFIYNSESWSNNDVEENSCGGSNDLTAKTQRDDVK
ncbi:uncharacterized protein LOC136081133 [Hydra vulgaris]|uniref:Uncharacterized protein LOC136081133 n=1 Tax=Hydra vulgaris TaxID=6087 RepID=A0ABM4BZ21_HYDVU